MKPDTQNAAGTDSETGLTQVAQVPVGPGGGVAAIYRVGRRVPRNVYQGDEPLFMAATSEQAAELVAVLNVGAGARTSRSSTERVRHVKTGGEYEVLGEAEAQVASATDDERGVLPNSTVLIEGHSVVVYRCVETDRMFCRRNTEFRDGRFETIADALPSGWRTMADCPSDGRQVWVYGGRYTEPTLRAADGSYWRSATAAGLGRPTHWHPEMKPTAPAAVLREPGPTEAAFNWKLSDETREHLAEIDRHTPREPGFGEVRS